MPKTKILMIQLQNAPYFGTAYLNSAVKAAGYKFGLLLSNQTSEIITHIAKEKPNIIGISCMSCFVKETIQICDSIKKVYDIPIVLGGPHPTLFPDIINEKSIDIICRGEGEFATVDLLAAIDKKKSYLHIKNLWVKSKNKIYKNPLRPLVNPLDKVPLIDWSCYKNTAVLHNAPTVSLIRGCPFNCSYCFNQTTRQLYQGLGPYIRHFSVERSIKEIKAALKYFSHSPLIFNSDTYGIDLPWMDKVLKAYSKITDLPFVLILRPELVTQECVNIIAKYKCYSVAIGVESGSPRMRHEILNRHYQNQLLLDVAKRLHKKNIKFRTYNMIGLPTETEKEMWQTIDINIKMKTDFPRAAIFTPFPGTKIVDLAIDKGYLKSNFSFNDLPDTILDRSVLKKIDRAKIQNTLFFFQSAIIFPQFRNLFKKLINIKPNILFRLWFYFIYAHLHRTFENRKLLDYLRYLYANRHYR